MRKEFFPHNLKAVDISFYKRNDARKIKIKLLLLRDHSQWSKACQMNNNKTNWNSFSHDVNNDNDFKVYDVFGLTFLL